MSAPIRPGSLGRSVRILRLLGALAVVAAVLAIITIVKGDAPGRSQALVALAIFLGAGALLGLAMAILSHSKRWKDQHDPRT